MPDEPKITPATLNPFPGNHTVRGTNFRCIAEDTGFVLTIYDKRMPQTAPYGTDLTRHWFEVIKVSLTPLAMKYLLGEVAIAVKIHEELFGPIPEPSDYENKVKGFIAKKGVQAAENLIKPPDQKADE